MKTNNIKISGTILSLLIIIISFVYAINIQPKVMGNSENLNDISKTIIASLDSEKSLKNNYKYNIDNKINLYKTRLNLNSLINYTNFSFYSNSIFYTISNFIIKINNFRYCTEIYTTNLR